jgi:hypothetical protein
MTTLTDLINRDGIRARWFWTHEVSTGPYSEYEVWDLVLIRSTEEPQKWVTDGSTRRTAYFRGIGGAVAESRRSNGGRHVNPELSGVLGELLMNAARYEEMPTLREWITERFEVSGKLDYDETEAAYNAARDAHAQLRHLLMDAYDEYAKAEVA